MASLASTCDGAALVNTLYIQRAGSRLHVANGCFSVEAGGRELVRPPLHEVKRIVLIGRIEVSRAALDLAARRGVPIALLSAEGRFRALVAPGDAPEAAPGATGEHALAARREQWRLELDASAGNGYASLAVARRFVEGKLENARSLLLKTGRRRGEADADDEEIRLRNAAGIIASSLEAARTANTHGELLGHEGAAGRAFFSALELLLAPNVRRDFTFDRRTRRPPRDPFNALLSFIYALLSGECTAAVRAAGLESGIGFLHRHRLGRPALALDLMEELRPALADRLALALVNRRQICPEHFHNPPAADLPTDDDNTPEEDTDPANPGNPTPPPVHLNETGRLVVLDAWRNRLGEEVFHPAAGRPVPWRLVPHLQAAELAAALARGEGATWRPFCPRF